MKKNKTRFSSEIQIKNRKARFEYEFIDTLEVGIMLKGSEIKSIREGKASLQESYCHFHKNALYIKGMNITPYKESTAFTPEPTRERKLLLHKREIEKWQTKMEEKGLTIVPVRLYINTRGIAKLNIALAKGKKLHDKRDSLRKKDAKREIEKMMI